MHRPAPPRVPWDPWEAKTRDPIPTRQVSWQWGETFHRIGEDQTFPQTSFLLKRMPQERGSIFLGNVGGMSANHPY